MAAPVGKRSIALNAIERLPRTARSPAGGIAALVVLNHDWLAAVSNSRAAVGRGGRAYFISPRRSAMSRLSLRRGAAVLPIKGP